MKLLGVFSILFIASKAMAIEYFCPKSIDTNQVLSKTMSDWSVVTDSSNLYLSTALFTDGDPNEKVYLHPDEETDGSKSSATWNFQDSTNVWLVCEYRSTTVKLTKKISSKLKKCTISSDASKGVTLESIKCL